MALVPHGDEKKKLKKALREKDRHDAEAEARVKALCGAEMPAIFCSAILTLLDAV